MKFNTEMQFAYGVPDTLAPSVARIVAPNAGPLTFKGTNTYLVGRKSLAVIDPGPESADHLRAVLAAAGDRPITHIISTHAHRDHVDGIPALKAATGARTYAFRRSAVAGTSGDDPGVEFVDYDFHADVHVSHGDSIEGEGWKLDALHTPGHAPDHLCFALAGQSILFVGDHVMAWNTSLVAPPEGRMFDYIRSLELLLARNEKLFLPGHGGAIDNARRTVKAYLLHRRWREQAIFDAVRNGTNTVRTLLPLIYRDVDKSVAAAAKLSLRAHLDHLADRGLIAAGDFSDADCEAVPL